MQRGGHGNYAFAIGQSTRRWLHPAPALEKNSSQPAVRSRFIRTHLRVLRGTQNLKIHAQRQLPGAVAALALG